jgi:hypothetical protein
VSERQERVVRRRFVALLALLVLLGVALFLVAIATISVASPGPPLPQIIGVPGNPSAARTATFTYTNIFEVSRFECSLDGSPFTTCGSERPSSTTYPGLAEGRHAFRVRAVSHGITGAARSYEWTIDLSPPPPPDGGGSDRPAPPSGPDGSGDDQPDTATPPDQSDPAPAPGDEDDGSDDGEAGGGDGGGGQSPPRGFSISGDVPRSSPLYPGGAARTIPLRVHNPNDAALHVTALTVALDAGALPRGCRASWFRITQSNASSSRTVAVPARGAVTLPASGVSAPTIRMVESGSDQDACARATLRLVYAGKART